MSQRLPLPNLPRALVEGQRLDQPTFHSLYEAMPPPIRAELIDGVVYMPSPVSTEHGVAHVPVIVWLDYYAEKTRGVQVMDNATTILGWKSETQPDGLLRILPAFGGRTSDEGGYVHGGRNWWSRLRRQPGTSISDPNCKSTSGLGFSSTLCSRSIPMRSIGSVKSKASSFEFSIAPDGLYRSRAFPGLWLDPQALLTGDRQRLRDVVDQGCVTQEHAAFKTRLATAEGKPQP